MGRREQTTHSTSSVQCCARESARPKPRFGGSKETARQTEIPSAQVISNSEVWDLRTFRLLHTVPTLDQCQVTFNGAGDVLYGAVLTEDDEDSARLFSSSFRTFHASDYSSIGGS